MPKIEIEIKPGARYCVSCHMRIYGNCMAFPWRADGVPTPLSKDKHDYFRCDACLKAEKHNEQGATK